MGCLMFPQSKFPVRLKHCRTGPSPGFKNIPKTSLGLYLLRQIRDEVHRFAITFHRQSRKKDMTKSIFEGIPSMGPKRIQKLWKEFESLEAIQKSSIKEIEGQTGFSKKLSSSILECARQKA